MIVRKGEYFFKLMCKVYNFTCVYCFRLCYYTTESLSCKSNFLKEVRTTYGTGGFVCSFNDKELSEFQHFLERKFPFTEGNRVKQGITYAGKQAGDSVWVMNKDLQIDQDGNEIPQKEAKYSWPPIGGPCIDLPGKSISVRSIDLQCSIHLPLSSEPLHKLLKCMQPVFKHNFVPGKLLRLYNIITMLIMTYPIFPSSCVVCSIRYYGLPLRTSGGRI